jgi:DNA-binding response OmpR family regulator
METAEAGLEVIRAAHRQSYAPATALLTAFPPDDEDWTAAQRTADRPDSLFIKPLGTDDLVRQIEALLVQHADQQQRRRAPLPSHTQPNKRSAG